MIITEVRLLSSQWQLEGEYSYPKTLNTSCLFRIAAAISFVLCPYL